MKVKCIHAWVTSTPNHITSAISSSLRLTRPLAMTKSSLEIPDRSKHRKSNRSSMNTNLQTCRKTFASSSRDITHFSSWCWTINKSLYVTKRPGHLIRASLQLNLMNSRTETTGAFYMNSMAKIIFSLFQSLILFLLLFYFIFIFIILHLQSRK